MNTFRQMRNAIRQAKETGYTMRHEGRNWSLFKDCIGGHWSWRLQGMGMPKPKPNDSVKVSFSPGPYIFGSLAPIEIEFKDLSFDTLRELAAKVAEQHGFDEIWACHVRVPYQRESRWGYKPFWSKPSTP